MSFFPIPFGHVEVRVDTRPQTPAAPPREAPAMRTETFQTPGETRLDIRLGAGEVRIETAEVQETTVVLEPLRDNEASTSAIENARVELRDRGNGHEVVIDVRDRGRGFSLSRGAEVLVAVTSSRRHERREQVRLGRHRGPRPLRLGRGRDRLRRRRVRRDRRRRARQRGQRRRPARLDRRRRADQHRLRRRADPRDRRRGQDQLGLRRRDHPRGPGRAVGQLRLRRRARARGRLVGRRQHGLRRPGDRQPSRPAR